MLCIKSILFNNKSSYKSNHYFLIDEFYRRNALWDDGFFFAYIMADK